MYRVKKIRKMNTIQAHDLIQYQNKKGTSWFPAALSKKDVPRHHMCKNEKEIIQKVWAH